ncbi:MAG: hypothetical protein EAZ55_05565 [Cytophagales bacterium]|nr:MAG: hypothetical protein EAZ55_05565 [Cytophagales bacterium]
MFISFETLPPEARIWVYTASRAWTKEEEQKIYNSLTQFVESWQSHQRPVKASFQLVAQRIIIIAADETNFSTSGCAIDGSVACLKNIEKELQLSLLDRSNLLYQHENEWKSCTIVMAKTYVQEGEILPNDLIVNVAITTVAQLATQLYQPAAESWLKRFFVLQT